MLLSTYEGTDTIAILSTFLENGTELFRANLLPVIYFKYMNEKWTETNLVEAFGPWNVGSCVNPVASHSCDYQNSARVSVNIIFSYSLIFKTVSLAQEKYGKASICSINMQQILTRRKAWTIFSNGREEPIKYKQDMKIEFYKLTCGIEWGNYFWKVFFTSCSEKINNAMTLFLKRQPSLLECLADLCL